MVEIHDRLRELETRRLQSLVSKRLDIAATLHAGDFQLVSPGGKVFTKEEYLGSIADGILDYAVFEAESAIDVRVQGDMAALRYIARIQLVVDEVRQPVMRARHTDVYENRDGQWQDVWSQATTIAE